MPTWIWSAAVLFVLAAGHDARSGQRSVPHPKPVALPVYPDGSGLYPTIQIAIDAARQGDTVLLFPGVYRGEGNRDLELRGKAITVRGLEGAERTIIDCQGSLAENHRGFRIHEGEGRETRIEGITILGGYISIGSGGGAICEETSPSFRFLKLIGNYARSGGGLAGTYDSGLSIMDSLISANSAYYGGGVAVRNGRCVLIGNTISRNHADTDAGGISLNQTEVVLEGNRIEFNGARSNGGGVFLSYVPSGSQPIVRRNLFRKNVCNGGGGGLMVQHSNPIVDSNIFLENTAAEGGGMHWDTLSPVAISEPIVNCVFLRNHALRGGGLSLDGTQEVRVVHCTFALNSAEDGIGGGIYFAINDEPSTVENSILWFNEAFDQSQIGIFAVGAPPVVRFSNVEGGWPGEGNLSGMPLFVDLASGEAGLCSGSPGIDAADGDASPPFDALGNPRYDDLGVPNTVAGAVNYADMGALERQVDSMGIGCP